MRHVKLITLYPRKVVQWLYGGTLVVDRKCPWHAVNLRLEGRVSKSQDDVSCPSGSFCVAGIIRACSVGTYSVTRATICSDECECLGLTLFGNGPTNIDIIGPTMLVWLIIFRRRVMLKDTMESKGSCNPNCIDSTSLFSRLHLFFLPRQTYIDR